MSRKRGRVTTARKRGLAFGAVRDARVGSWREERKEGQNICICVCVMLVREVVMVQRVRCFSVWGGGGGNGLMVYSQFDAMRGVDNDVAKNQDKNML